VAQKKNSPASAEVRRSLLEPGHASISLRRQCDLLDLPRSTAYYAPVPESADNLRLMREIDAVYLENPAFGSRTIAAVLSNGGWPVNRKRVQRLMRLMNLAGVTPKRTTSKPTPGHRVFAYLLRNVAITHPDHVWSTDVTYVPLRHGFVYLRNELSAVSVKARFDPPVEVVIFCCWGSRRGAGVRLQQAAEPFRHTTFTGFGSLTKRDECFLLGPGWPIRWPVAEGPGS
jgi:putative transposase